MTTAVLEHKDDDVDAETQKRQGEAREAVIRLFQLTDWPQHKWGPVFLGRPTFEVIGTCLSSSVMAIDFYRKRIDFRQALGSVTGRTGTAEE